jgi:hypothetical protein
MSNAEYGVMIRLVHEPQGFRLGEIKPLAPGEVVALRRTNVAPPFLLRSFDVNALEYPILQDPHLVDALVVVSEEGAGVCVRDLRSQENQFVGPNTDHRILVKNFGSEQLLITYGRDRSQRLITAVETLFNQR